MSFDNIQLTFLVRDGAGNFVRDLSKDDFQVTENGERQVVAALRQQEVPISVIVLVDTSWSIRPFLKNAVDTALNVFKGLEGAGDSAALVFFSDEPRVMLGWDERPDDLDHRFADVKTDGQTALHDSVIWVCETMFEGQTGKKVIVLVSDGIDTTSKASFQDMMNSARRHGVTFYSILYSNPQIDQYRRLVRFSNAPARRNVSQQFHNMILLQNRFLEQSLRHGGRSIFSNGFSDLHDIYGQIVRDMKSQYVMLYQSENAERSDVRDVRVSTRKDSERIYINISY